nr:OsmC family protein [Aquibacillus sediminis]
MKFTIDDHGVHTMLPHNTLHISKQEQHGYRPYQLLIASIVGCSGNLLRQILNKKRIDYHTLQVSMKLKEILIKQIESKKYI